MRPGNTNGHGCQSNGSYGLVDESRGQSDTLSMSDNAETEVMGHSNNLGTYLGIEDSKCRVGQTDTPSFRNETRTPANIRRNIRTCQTEVQT